MSEQASDLSLVKDPIVCLKYIPLIKNVNQTKNRLGSGENPNDRGGCALRVSGEPTRVTRAPGGARTFDDHDYDDGVQRTPSGRRFREKPA